MDSIGPLRIVLVAPPYFNIPPAAYGGIEAVVADLADALVDRGHRVTLIANGPNGTKAEFIALSPDIQADRLGQPFPEVAHAAAVHTVITRLAELDRVDVVHDHTLAGPLNAPFFRTLGLPTVVTAHGPVAGDMLDLYRTLGKEVFFVAISDRQRELAPELNWIGTVYNAVRTGTFPYRDRLDKRNYALFLGRFHPEKGPHLALDAAHAAGLPLVLAGKVNEPQERAYFEAEIRPRLTATDYMFGMADAAQKRKLLSEAKCLLFPVQWEEPFGMVMIEAMACGTPVVALRGGAVAEVVEHGVTGLICDHPDKLAKALVEVDSIDPAACRARVETHFDVDLLGRGYESMYRQAIAAVGRCA